MVSLAVINEKNTSNALQTYLHFPVFSGALEGYSPCSESGFLRVEVSALCQKLGSDAPHQRPAQNISLQSAAQSA